MSEKERCLKDPIYFIENYCLINGEHIKLKDSQKKYIEWMITLPKKV